MMVTNIPIVICAFGTVSKRLLKGLEDLDTIKTWERTEYWEESCWLKETWCHSNSSEKTYGNDDVKDSQGVNNDNFT